MTLGKNLLFCLVCLFLLASGATTASAAVIYSQDFTHPEVNSNNISFNAAGVPWTAYATANATAISNLSSGTYTALVGPYTTNVRISSNVGYAYTRASNSSVSSVFALLSDSFISPANWTSTGLETFVYANASHAEFDVRLLIQLENRWYASSQNLNLALGTLTQFRSNSATEIQRNSLNYSIQSAASHWVNFNFVAGQGMSLGGAVSNDLTGALTRVGFYTVQPANPGDELSMARFDALVISQVPEPSKLLLVLSGLMLLVLRRRRN